MPRGKKGRKNKFNESALTTRLIQISMKMDDHIYNDQLVTRSEAANFLQEIATLKLRCLPTNVRALQVIEKLTLFMTLILNEDGYTTNSHNQSFQITYEFAGSASPVYSLPDEDRNMNNPGQNYIEDVNVTNVTDDDVTHKEMDITNVTDDDVTGKEIDITDVTDDNVTHKEMDITNVTDDNVTHKEIVLSDQTKTVNISQVDDSTYNKNTIEDIEVIDITNDSDIQQGIQNAKTYEQLDSIERVNTGISTMTLQDNDGSLTQCDDNICSQSILDNYDNDITNEVCKENDRTKGVIMILNSEIKETRITDNVNKHYQINTSLPAMASNTTITDPKLMVSQPNNVAVVNRKPVHSDFIENTDKGKKVTNKNNNNLKRRRTKKNKELKGDNAVNSKHVSIHYSGKESNPKTVEKPKKNKKVNEIYNENVENDLSWVENLRFVREISPNEYDPALTLLQDNFWDNFQLPGTWDDLDFNV
ncbi:probable serine/threonine-protein kinase DDB_G0283337 [Cydia amplana]|uniref:probable serine/threonine-protein kinase DDB_G0283337 n=1 Tax=Cydia amplana TaxID=1869771 RepID=UPI002FE64F0C